MKLKYPTIYSDSRGTENSEFITDGIRMTIRLRGVTFEGHFWELTPLRDQKEIANKLFDLNEFGELNGIIDEKEDNRKKCFSLTVLMPIKVISKDNLELDALIEFGMNPHKMNFLIEDEIFEAENPNFEFGLDVKHTKSLNINYIKCCINCKFSTYSPFGSQEYGDLMCFKNCKKEWESMDYIDLKDEKNWQKVKNKQTTQEAFCCDEFELKTI